MIFHGHFLLVKFFFNEISKVLYYTIPHYNSKKKEKKNLNFYFTNNLQSQHTQLQFTILHHKQFTNVRIIS